VKVSASKGLANHTVPESWLVYREVYLQALTGVRVGQPLSREILPQGADVVTQAEGNTDRSVTASTCTALRGLRPWHARTLLVWEPGDLLLDHPKGVARVGKVRSRSR
jgi:hypothetical protein